MKFSKKSIITSVVCFMLASTLIITAIVPDIRQDNEGAVAQTTSDTQSSATQIAQEDSSVLSDITVEELTTSQETTTQATTKKAAQTQQTKQTNKKAQTNVKTTEQPKKAEPKPTTTNPPEIHPVISDEIARKINDEFFDLVNAERQRVGVEKLTRNTQLDTYANTRSNELVTKFSHDRLDGSPFHSIIDSNNYPYQILGENICKTTHLGDGEYAVEELLFSGTDEQIHQAAQMIFTCFKNSPPHYSSMIDERFKDTGIGISYKENNEYGYVVFYVSQLFGTQV